MQDPAVAQLVTVLLSDQRTRCSGGIERLLVRLSNETGRKAFEDWSKHEVTKVFLDALKSLAETYPLRDGRDVAMAYGCQCGIGLAARLLEDPTRVFPSIFDGTASLAERMTQVASVEPSYTISPESDDAATKGV